MIIFTFGISKSFCRLTRVISLIFVWRKAGAQPKVGSWLPSQQNKQHVVRHPHEVLMSPEHRECTPGAHTRAQGPGNSLLLSKRCLITCAQLEIRQTQRCGSCHLLPSLQMRINGAQQKPLLHVFSCVSDPPPTQCSILIIF